MSSQWVTNVGDGTIRRNYVASNCPVTVYTIQLIVSFDVFGIGKLKGLSLLTRPSSILLELDERPIVPVDLCLQHIVLLFEERISRFLVEKLIF